ncbi:MAG: hypothetical protein NC432_15070 [Roseburia sp.]|nr:hypothetical protein [Roseburia sp.]MCM1097236.1 hypothetical protein [Ruminococcus flavefaciens]
MEEKGNNPVSAFDTLYTTNRIQMLKVLLTWLPPERQGGFAVYIKLLELQYAFSLLGRYPGTVLSGGRRLSADLFSGDTSGAVELLDELLPFSGFAERSRIEGMKSLLQNMSRMKEMMEMLDMLKEMFPEGFGGDTGNPMDLFSGMTGMDLSAVANLFGKED